MIRKAKNSDREAIYQLMCELEEKVMDKTMFTSYYQRNLEHPDYVYLVAQEEERVVGFVSLFLHHPLHHSALIGEIEELCVTKDARHQHIGFQLFERIKEEALQLGCIQIELSCNKTREAAHRFYTYMGMEENHDKFTYCLEDEI